MDEHDKRFLTRMSWTLFSVGAVMGGAVGATLAVMLLATGGLLR